MAYSLYSILKRFCNPKKANNHLSTEYNLKILLKSPQDLAYHFDFLLHCVSCYFAFHLHFFAADTTYYGFSKSTSWFLTSMSLLIAFLCP